MIFGFSRMRAVSTGYNKRPAEASRPFDRGRDGFVLGEGAWMVVLEREDRAIARGATRYARVESYFATCDAYHRVQMNPDGAEIVRCMETALAKANRHPTEIGYVNYHGTATQLNDTVESQCARRVFGEHADHQPARSGSGLRHGFHPERCPVGRYRRGAVQLPGVRVEEQRARSGAGEVTRGDTPARA
jgi:3-oxoacyl-[acyl-carrier-protein] synthase II